MTAEPPTPYRVLARKYRPRDFSTLYGQEALVRTLSNAIATGRIAQAFVLTGVRGIGKTTTARIIARALNCTGADGQGGPTVAPCGVCPNCQAIAEDRHADVIEMDAASHTGIDNIRDLTDGVRYLPILGRYKIYILDEVHMLSDKAFNALLKTLEEPPAHVKFVFCTTEIRKVPVTVLSRCQRFDLRRLDPETAVAFLTDIAGREAVEADPEALKLIARAAEGSARDGLSLLDQAIAHGGGKVALDPVRDMLGLADRGLVVDLFETLMKGEIAAALASLRNQYDRGADPLAVLQDLLELTHWITRIKVAPDAAGDVTAGDDERRRARDLAARLPMPVLARNWQMLLKGLSEARGAPSPIAATEMVLVRLAFAADLPSPADLVRDIRNQGGNAAGPGAPVRPGGGGGATALAAVPPAPRPAAAPVAQAAAATVAIADFAGLVALAGERRQGVLQAHLIRNCHLVRFEPGRIELRLTPAAPRALPNDLALRLREWTGQTWMVGLSEEAGEPTIQEQRDDDAAAAKRRAADDPLVRAVLAAFPGAEIAAVRKIAPEPAAAPAPAEAGDDAAEDDYDLLGDG